MIFFCLRQAEAMLQIDGKSVNKCTCFMYFDHTPKAEKLLEMWKHEIISTNAQQNQVGREVIY